MNMEAAQQVIETAQATIGSLSDVEQIRAVVLNALDACAPYAVALHAEKLDFTPEAYDEYFEATPIEAQQQNARRKADFAVKHFADNAVCQMLSSRKSLYQLNAARVAQIDNIAIADEFFARVIK